MAKLRWEVQEEENDGYLSQSQRMMGDLISEKKSKIVEKKKKEKEKKKEKNGFQKNSCLRCRNWAKQIHHPSYVPFEYFHLLSNIVRLYVSR